MRYMLRVLVVPVATVAVACGADAVEPDQLVEIEFDALFGTTAFVCGDTYEEQGAPPVALVPTDLRFFVSEVAVIGADGVEYPVALIEDGVWQTSDVALIDLENGLGACDNGSTGLNPFVRGYAATSTVAGVAFTVGVPFALNHANPDQAVAPLSSTAMSWGWQGGYKFLRFEATAADTDYRVHVGSTGCIGTIGNISECTHPNRARVRIDTFNPITERVVLDLERLFEGVDLAYNTPQTALGCMGNFDDPECVVVFERLGIDVNTGVATGEQIAFRSAAR